MEARHDVGGLGDRPGIGGHQQPGVIVDHVQDLDLGAVGQAPVGDVGLPSLVRQIGFEPDERGAGRFCGWGVTKPRRRKDPPDRRDRRAGAVAARQVIGDRVGAGIQALIGERLAKLDDLVLDLDRGLLRAPTGPA